MKTAVIVQARMSSNRLPGKVLMQLAGRSVLDHVLTRCRRIANADILCCAIPQGAQHAVIADEAQRCGAVVFRGSEDDVLARYRKAAQFVGADVILRVTSDCPLIDPEVCAMTIDLRAREAADYACNNRPPSWPHGLDCEAFTYDALVRADENADATQREHVTTWLRENAGQRRANLSCPETNLAHHRWTLDYPEDFAFFQAVFERLPDQNAGWRDVFKLLSSNPEIVQINAMHSRTHVAELQG